MVQCNACGMVFVSRDELKKHTTKVHNDSFVQCQSCNRMFDNVTELDRHAAKFHGGNRDFAQQVPEGSGEEEIESTLFRKTEEEQKARRHTRGPYRKI